MKRIPSLTTLAIAGAMSVGVATAGATVPASSTRSRPAPAALKGTQGSKVIERSGARVVEDDVFRVTRSVAMRAGSRRVVFCATDLRSGKTVRLN
jgi:hypothetical protein